MLNSLCLQFFNPAICTARVIAATYLPEIGSFLTTSASKILVGIAVLLLQIPLVVANTFLLVTSYFLKTVTGSDFISLSYTKLDNPIINAGWTATSSLANMMIVIALLVIGIATILRYENYQAKKTLPTLIIVALLINFSPVICGVIVDAANILMNFFLADHAANVTSTFYNNFSQQDEALKSWWSNTWSNADTTLAPLATSVTLIIFEVIASFVFFIFAILFLVRYVAIWILVILSPLAFAAYILPATKKYATQWWNYFIQWCFIGTTAAFFIYLADAIRSDPQIQSMQGGINSFLGLLFVSAVVSAFLIFGLFAALSISAYGAQTVLSYSKKTGKFVGVRTGGRLLTSRAGQWVANQLSRIPNARELWSKGKKTGGAKGWAYRAASAASFLGTMSGATYGLRALGNAGVAYSRERQRRVEQKKKEAEEKYGTDKAGQKAMADAYRNIPLTEYEQKIAYALALIEKGAKAFELLPEEFREEALGLMAEHNPELLKNAIKLNPTDEAFMRGPNADFLKKQAGYVDASGNALSGIDFVKKVFTQFKGDDWSKVSDKILEGPDAVYSTLAMIEDVKNPKHWEIFINNVGIDKAKVLSDEIKSAATAAKVTTENYLSGLGQKAIFDYFTKNPGAAALLDLT